MTSDGSSWATVEDFLQTARDDEASCFHRTQWDQLCLAASRANGNLACEALDMVANGMYNIVRPLEFSDKSRWAARVYIRATTAENESDLEASVATMQYIRNHSDLPIPRVFAHAANEDNPVAAAYMLIELLPGIVAMDAFGGYEKHRGELPTECRPVFYRSVAKRHVGRNALSTPFGF